MHRPNSKWKTDEFYTESGCSTRVYAHSLWFAANCEGEGRERVLSCKYGTVWIAVMRKARPQDALILQIPPLSGLDSDYEYSGSGIR